MRNYLNLQSNKPRTRKDMAEYLKTHPGHSDSWAGPIYFSRNVKISYIQDTTHEEDDKCLELLDFPWCYDFSGVNGILEWFAKDHPGYNIYFAGRSCGYLELHGGNFYPSRTDDYSDFSWEDLRELFGIVWDFDQTCQMAVDAFVEYANSVEIEAE